MLSKKCQYALHALKYIASAPTHTRHTIQEIADAENIPKKFLEVILYDLKSSGILTSRRGKDGGYYLNREATSVSVLEVIRIIDGAVAMVPCVSLNFYESCGRCSDESTCGINALFGKVRDEMIKILSVTSISDLKTFNAEKVLSRMPVGIPGHQTSPRKYS